MTMQPRKTIYNGIKMRSRLEAGYAAWLDSHEVPWTYEPHAFASVEGQYLPDFRLELWDGTVVYVEVKPRQPEPGTLIEMLRNQPYGEVLAGLARRMGVIWESEPDACLLLTWPGMAADHVADVLRLVRCADPDEMGAAAVFFGFHWSWDHKARLGLARPLHPSQEAWPAGYWEVP